MKDWIFSSSQGGESLPHWSISLPDTSGRVNFPNPRKREEVAAMLNSFPQPLLGPTIHHPTLKWQVWLVLCWNVATVEKTRVSILTGNTGYGTTQSNFYLSIRCRKLQQEKLKRQPRLLIRFLFSLLMVILLHRSHRFPWDVSIHQKIFAQRAV